MMPRDTPAGRHSRAFLIVLSLIALLFAVSVAPFMGAILWALAAAIIFLPLQRRLHRAGLSVRFASALTVAAIALAVVTPALILGAIVTDQAASIIARIQSGDIDIAAGFARFVAHLPPWMADLLRQNGMGDGHNLASKVATRVTAPGSLTQKGLVGAAKTLAAFALNLFVMLYLAYFLLVDGASLRRRAAWLIPMNRTEQAMLAERFAAVVRATVMGSIVIGIAQGAVGGVIMAIIGVPNAALWAVMMAFASLVPAAGTGIVWVPVALYLFGMGEMARGIAMVLCGLVIIGSVDTILRPILVRRATRIPDGIVLVTTLGGASMFGFSGVLIGPMSAALFLAGWIHVARGRWQAPG